MKLLTGKKVKREIVRTREDEIVKGISFKSRLIKESKEVNGKKITMYHWE